jgi:sugar/nucleoside kinase (ribokinase family)
MPPVPRSFLVVGEPIHDVYVHGRVARRANEGDFPVYEATKSDLVPGGALNVALALAAAEPGASVELVVPPCTLEHGGEAAREREEIDRRLRAAGVRLAEPYRAGELRPVLRKVRYLDGENGSPLICVEPPRRSYYAYGADAVAETVALLAESGRSYDAVLVTDYGGGAIDPPFMRSLRARFPRATIYLDPHVTSSVEMGGYADVVKLNEKELRFLSRGDNFFRFRDPEFPTRNIETIVTDGERPVRVHERDGSFYAVSVPSLPKAVDPCGAGDVFFAHYAARRTDGIAPRKAVEIAGAAAVLTLSRRGNYVPSFLEVDEFRRNFERFVPA